MEVKCPKDEVEVGDCFCIIIDVELTAREIDD